MRMKQMIFRGSEALEHRVLRPQILDPGTCWLSAFRPPLSSTLPLLIVGANKHEV